MQTKIAPHGQRLCENCVFYHPERPKRPCSVFKQLQNQEKDCSAYIEKAKKVTVNGD